MPGEGRPRRVVEVAAEDRPHVGAGDHLGERVLVEQLDDLRRAQHRHRDRRVVQREQRAVLGRGGQLVGQPVELVGGQLAVVVAGHAGVERQHPQPAHVVHPVLRAVVVGAEQAPRVRRPLVVVAHRPHDLRPELGGHRLDQLAQPGVRRGLGLVGEVAGEHQDVRRRVEPAEPLEREHQPGLGVDDAVLPRPSASRCGSLRWATVCRGGGY